MPFRTVSLASLSVAVALTAGCHANPTRRSESHPDSGAPRDASVVSLESFLGPNIVAADPPPPISGGTLLVTHDDALAIVADPDRDRIVVVDLASRIVLGEIALEPHDEPGRLVEDAAGRVHVALRRGGALVSFDPITRTILARRAVCSAPRGLAYDEALDALHVACAGGELVTVPAADGPATRTLQLDRDLRDVVVDGDLLYVSLFREADVLVLDAAGTIVERIAVPNGSSSSSPRARETTASVAWRMIRNPAGGVLVLHQRGSRGVVATTSPSGYGSGGSCETRSSIVTAAVTPISRGALPPVTEELVCVALGVDVALSPVDDALVIASAGNALVAPQAQLLRFSASLAMGATAPDGVPIVADEVGAGSGRIVAVAYTSTGVLVAQTREPSRLAVVDSSGVGTRFVTLGGASREDTGHTIFHSATAGGIACASCHPEGRDDGRVWSFEGIGERRTQSLGGGILATAPFHWSGDMPSFDHLMSDVFGSRMSGGDLSPTRIDAVAHWVDVMPTLPAIAPVDAAAVERGRALFEDEIVGCADCHSGPHLTSNETVDVGTGGSFQVPSLHGVAWRAPYLHDGCAATLRDRFGACGGGARHGRVEGLDAAQLDDLVAYLETL